MKGINGETILANASPWSYIIISLLLSTFEGTGDRGKREQIYPWVVTIPPLPGGNK